MSAIRIWIPTSGPARIVDVQAGIILKQRTIAIEDEAIVAVTSSQDVSIPSESVLVDLTGYTVLPGLIHAHTHLLKDSNDHGLRSLLVSLPEATTNGVNNAAATLLAGFTTVPDVGAPGYADVALRDAIAAGEVQYPATVRIRRNGARVGEGTRHTFGDGHLRHRAHCLHGRGGRRLSRVPEKEREVGKVQRESFRRAHEAGIEVVYGTDSGTYPHGDNARQFSTWCGSGAGLIVGLIRLFLKG